MARALPWVVTLALASFVAATQLGVGPTGALSGAAAGVLVIVAACGVSIAWGIRGAPAASLAAVALVGGVPVTRDALIALLADPQTLSMTLGSLTLPLFVGTVVSLRRQVGIHRDAAGRAQYDVLTGLLNRVALEARLATWIAQSRQEQTKALFAVLFIDLDRFKVVNDTYGHEIGDRLLCAVAALIRQHVREGDLVARLGGDEFVVALPGLRDRQAAAAIATKLVSLLSAPIELFGKVVSVSASIGIAVYPHDGEDVSSLLTSADSAMYAVKSRGKNSFVFSDVRLRGEQARRIELERRLRLAVNDHRLHVAYQPQVDLTSRRVVAFEALLRWDDEELGKVSPAEFVPIAEEAGLIVPVGLWLLREACFQARMWDMPDAGPIGVSVNVSTLQFRQRDFVEQVEAALSDSRLGAERLEVEVTESVLIDEFEVAVRALRRLHRLGVGAALDDFGTGYSSLAYLQRLPIASLKIDRSFVSGLGSSMNGHAGAVPIVDAIAAMGRALGKTVVAEGVETPAQARYLSRIGVVRAQGYHFGKPLPAADATRLVERQAQASRTAARVAAPPRLPSRGYDSVPQPHAGHVELLLD